MAGALSRKLAKFAEDPSTAHRKLYLSIGRRLNKAYHRRLGARDYNPDGIDVFEEDWDNLIILDACRLDYFREYDLPGHLESRYTRGSSTFEFLTANFSGKQLHDVVYVSANAWFPRLRDSINAEIHEFVNLEEEAIQDEELGVELPEQVTKYAVAAADRYPNKRLIVHYVQPHYPYIGDVGREHIPAKMQMKDAILESGVSASTLKEAYRENLRLVVDELPDLFRSLLGKSVVTADHGEMLGERSFPFPFVDYGHPAGHYNRTLVEVPWLIYENGGRKTIHSEPPTPDTTTPEEQAQINQKLQNLGYKVE